jgi:hypothetical protein
MNSQMTRGMFLAEVRQSGVSFLGDNSLGK